MTVTPGYYTGLAIDYFFGKAQTGTEFICVTFEITESRDNPEAVGAQLQWHGYFGPKSQARTLDALEACGWDGRSMEDLSGIYSQQVDLTVEENTNPNTGYVDTRVAWVNALGSGAKRSKMSDTDTLDFMQRMRGEVAARNQARGTPPPPSARSQAGQAQQRQAAQQQHRGSPHDPPASARNAAAQRRQPPPRQYAQPPAAATTPPPDDDIPF